MTSSRKDKEQEGKTRYIYIKKQLMSRLSRVREPMKAVEIATWTRCPVRYLSRVFLSRDSLSGTYVSSAKCHYQLSLLACFTQDWGIEKLFIRQFCEIASSKRALVSGRLGLLDIIKRRWAVSRGIGPQWTGPGSAWRTKTALQLTSSSPTSLRSSTRPVMVGKPFEITSSSLRNR